MQRTPTTQLGSLFIGKAVQRTMRGVLFAITMLCGSLSPAHAEVSINIGINMPTYPNLVLVPDYPVYYDPYADSNYFFYDGEYWVYEDDNWYSSAWYNGPWEYVEPNYVPLFLLRVPVRYYRRPPPYFRGWIVTAPPRWGDHWGRNWQQQRRGWDQWNRRSVPAAAPLPIYQRNYSGDRYPRAVEQQHSIRSDRYRYQPRESITRQHLEQRSRRVEVSQRQRNAPNVAPSVDQRSNRDSNRQPANHRAAQLENEQPVSPRVTPPVRRPNQERPDPRPAVQSPLPPAQQPQARPERQSQPERESQRENQERNHDRDNEAAPRGKKPQGTPQDKERENKRDDRGERHR